MNYEVRLLARAREDLDEIVTYISWRSTRGAARLVASFEDALVRLQSNPFASAIAPESQDLGEDLRHIMFRTRSGRPYRALFVIVGNEVRVLRVRGPGQRPLRAEDL